MEIIIRKIRQTDIEDISRLCDQLGYPLPIDRLKKNIEQVINHEDHDAFVAIVEEKIAGWIGVSNSLQIEVAAYTEIHGLVIDDQYRNMGLGKKLVEKAKEWSKEKGNLKIGLHCNVKRTATHSFYEYLGFTEIKQQKVYEIML